MVREPGQHWHEMLRDRSRVTVRPLARDDVPSVAALLEALAPLSRRVLFLAGITRSSHDALYHSPDAARGAAFVAVDACDPSGRLIGLGRYVRDAESSSAEFSLAVAEEWRHRGLGTLLLRHLIETAREHGIDRLYSIDAVSDDRMRQLATNVGFKSRVDPIDTEQLVLSLDLHRWPEAGLEGGAR